MKKNDNYRMRNPELPFFIAPGVTAHTIVFDTTDTIYLDISAVELTRGNSAAFKGLHRCIVYFDGLKNHDEQGARYE